MSWVVVIDFDVVLDRSRPFEGHQRQVPASSEADARAMAERFGSDGAWWNESAYLGAHRINRVFVRKVEDA